MSSATRRRTKKRTRPAEREEASVATEPDHEPATAASAAAADVMVPVEHHEPDDLEMEKSEDEGERDRYRPRPRIGSRVSAPVAQSTVDAAITSHDSEPTPQQQPSQPMVIVDRHQSIHDEMDTPMIEQSESKKPSPSEGTLSQVLPTNRPKIDRDSLTIVFEFMTIDELVTKVHRLCREWMNVLLSYQPSSNHPSRLSDPINLLDPRTHQDERETMRNALNRHECRQFWMLEENLNGLAKAAPIYRQLVHTLILDSGAHLPNSYTLSKWSPMTVSHQLMDLISNTELFPSLKFLYCSLSGYPLTSEQSNTHSANSEEEKKEEKKSDSDEKNNTQKRLLTWRLPPKLYTLDVFVETPAIPWSPAPIPPTHPDVLMIQDIFDHIGQTTSIHRLAITYNDARDQPLSLKSMNALTPLKDLTELRLFGGMNLSGWEDSLEPKLPTLSLLKSFPKLTSFTPWFRDDGWDGPNSLGRLAATGVPIEQWWYLPKQMRANENQYYINGRRLNWLNFPLLGMMNKLRELDCGVERGVHSNVFLSLPNSLTSIEINIQGYITTDVVQAMSHCHLVRIFRLEGSFLQEDDRNVTRKIQAEVNNALARMFGGMKEIESIDLSVRRGLSSRAINQMHAPHLPYTLKTLRLGRYDNSDLPHWQPLDLSDIENLQSLTKLTIAPAEIQPNSGDKLTQIFNSLTSLTDITFPSQLHKLNHILEGPLKSVMNSRIASQLHSIQPVGILMDIDPSRYHQLSQLVSLRSLVIRRLEGDAYFLSRMRSLTALSMGLGDAVISMESSQNEENKDAIEQYQEDTKTKRALFQNIVTDSQIIMKEISQLCWLREMTISELKDFNSQHLIQVITPLSHLAKLSLIDLPELIDLAALSQRRETLRDLTLKRLPRLASNTLVDSVGTLTRLRRLTILNCTSLSPNSFRVLSRLRYLVHLMVDVWMKIFLGSVEDAMSMVDLRPEYALAEASNSNFLEVTCEHRSEQEAEEVKRECCRRHPFIQLA